MAAARVGSGSVAVISIVFGTWLVRVTTRSASWRPDSDVPSCLATASGTSPVVARMAIWSTFVYAWLPESFDDVSSCSVLVAL